MAAQDVQHLYSLPIENIGMASNNYNDLTNKPKINNVVLVGEKSLADIGVPTKTSELTNDAGFITDADVPTKTSELTNDSDFTTKDYVDDEIANIKQKINLIDNIQVIESFLSEQTFTSTFDNLATNLATQIAALKTALQNDESLEILALRIVTIGNVKPSRTIIIDSATDLLSLVIDWQGVSYNSNVLQAIDIVNKKVLQMTMVNDRPANDSFVSYFEDVTTYTFTIEYRKYKKIELT